MSAQTERPNRPYRFTHSTDVEHTVQGAERHEIPIQIGEMIRCVDQYEGGWEKSMNALPRPKPNTLTELLPAETTGAAQCTRQTLQQSVRARFAVGRGQAGRGLGNERSI